MLDGFGQNELMDEPLFLKVRPGDAVLYEKDQIGKVLTFVGGSRDPDAPSLFQIANVDSGEIRWIHGEEVTEIVAEYRTTIKKPSSFYEQIQQQQYKNLQKAKSILLLKIEKKQKLEKNLNLKKHKLKKMLNLKLKM